MKNIFAGLLFAIAIFSLFRPGHLQAQQTGGAVDNLQFLKQLNGKYAYREKLFDNAGIKKRLEKLLGGQYEYFIKSIWQVETPMKVENDFFYAWAMQAHSGGDPSATLLADIHTNMLYVEIIKGGHTTTYAEDGSKTVPKELKEWAKAQVSK